MVKILGICGSPRRKSSYTALKAALDAAAEQTNVETELIELMGRKINPCIHCNKCVKKDSDRCAVYEDGMTELYDKFYRADGIIIASPVYEMNVTPQLAAFFSRFRSAWMVSAKEPYFFTKKVGTAIVVGGTRNGGQESTINAINNFFNTQGVTICGGGAGVYAGVSLWNPGDGSTEMHDETGMENAVKMGRKIAVMAKALENVEVLEEYICREA